MMTFHISGKMKNVPNHQPALYGLLLMEYDPFIDGAPYENHRAMMDNDGGAPVSDL